MSKALQCAFETIAELSHRYHGVPPKGHKPRLRTHQLLDDIRNQRFPDPPKPWRAEILCADTMRTQKTAEGLARLWQLT